MVVGPCRLTYKDADIVASEVTEVGKNCELTMI